MLVVARMDAPVAAPHPRVEATGAKSASHAAPLGMLPMFRPVTYPPNIIPKVAA